MSHVAWDPDLPEEFVRHHEVVLKAWVSRVIRGGATNMLRLDLPPLVAVVPGDPASVVRTVWVKLSRQMRIGALETRYCVQPATVADGKILSEWSKRKEQTHG